MPDLKDRLLLREFAPELLTAHDTRKEGEESGDSEGDTASGGGGDDSGDSDDELPVFTLLAGRA